MKTVLVVGGTGEARALAARLVDVPGLRVVSSLAGAVARPRLPAGEVRVGGFGGPEGLARWLRDHEAAAVVDASHPFAARISASCVAAAADTGVPLLRLERPAWCLTAGDDWQLVPNVPEAAALLPELAADLGHARVLLTTGRRDLPEFYGLHGLSFVARCVDPPSGAVPANVEVLLDRGPYTVEGETRLLRDRRIDVLVTKNSGGSPTEAKLVAARSLGVRVVMVQRPSATADTTPPAVVHDVDAAAAWVTATA